MPYANTYNGQVAVKVRKIIPARVSTENAINDDVHPNDPVTSQVESMALKHPDVEGGSGYAAATLGDLGYEPTLGVDGPAKITVQAKPFNAAHMGGAGEVGGSASTAPRKKRNDLIREIMKGKGMSLPEASKHIKENNLY